MSTWHYRESLMLVGDQLRRQGTGPNARGASIPADGVSADRLQADIDPITATAEWATEWSRANFPLVRLSDLHAARLMATPARPKLQSLVAPWHAFAIEVPEGMLLARDPRGAAASVTTAHVLVRDGNVQLFGSSGEGVVWATAFRRLASLGESIDDVSGGARTSTLESMDERMLALLDRLLVGTCLELNSPGHRSVIEAGVAERAKPKKPRDLRIWLYRVERPVLVDVREAVRHYVVRGGAPPNLRPVVPRCV
ncbi:hypothetical protein LZC95_19575 [Pendulispora brunnea]|uniref:Uncharacterized protein n=1 Tax=Pendulispora brunnea TaxID=2905690 RepID=A0ABZ2KNU3_9BACT